MHEDYTLTDSMNKPKAVLPDVGKNDHTYVLVTGTHSDIWMVCYGGRTNKLQAYWRKRKKKEDAQARLWKLFVLQLAF